MDNGIYFGAMADPLSKQLKGLLPHFVLRMADRRADEIVDLHVSGLLTDSEVHRARQRLLVWLQKQKKKGQVK